VITPAESGASELVGRENRSWTVNEGLVLKYRPMQIADKIPKIPLNKYMQVFDLIWKNIEDEKIKARIHAVGNLDIRLVARKYEKFIQKCLEKNEFQKTVSNVNKIFNINFSIKDKYFYVYYRS